MVDYVFCGVVVFPARFLALGNFFIVGQLILDIRFDRNQLVRRSHYGIYNLAGFHVRSLDSGVVAELRVKLVLLNVLNQEFLLETGAFMIFVPWSVFVLVAWLRVVDVDKRLFRLRLFQIQGIVPHLLRVRRSLCLIAVLNRLRVLRKIIVMVLCFKAVDFSESVNS